MRATLTSNGQSIISEKTIIPFPAEDKGNSLGNSQAAPPKPESSQHARSTPKETAYRLSSLLLIGDWFVSCFAIFVGLGFREWQRIGLTPNFDTHFNLGLTLLLWSMGGGLLFSWFMSLFGSYEPANLYRLQLWSKNVLKSVGLWSMTIWAVIGVFQITDFTPRLGVVYCGGTLIVFTMLWRLCSLAFLVQPKIKETACSRVIVVGWNEKAAHFRRALRRDFAHLEEIIGCVPAPGGRFATRPPAELAILGDYSALPSLVKECGANAVLLSDVSCPSSEIQNLISFCQREILVFQMIPEYFPALNSGLQVQTVSGVPLLGVTRLPLDRTLQRAIKRVIDIVGGLFGFIFSAPIIAFFGVLVYLESPGPIIHRQRRNSRLGRTFEIYKIRSMKPNAEAATGAVWCKKEDSRRLKIGTFMRKTNIDELPQFWNVLIGDMSLVGPRPERPELIERFKDEIPNYNARHEVRAGLTGWAQVNGLRGDTDLRKRIEADLYYMENWSLMLDLYCLFATVFKNKNAH